MNTVIYLSNRDVKALVGAKTKNQLAVHRICHGQAPEGSIVNGRVADEAIFSDFLMEFWRQNKLPVKHVTLVLTSTQAITRLIEVPVMPYKKMMEYLPREFADVERTKDPVYSYAELYREGSLRSVMAAMVDRSFLEPHIQRFKQLGIKLEAIMMASMGEIQVLNRLGYLKDKTSIVQKIDDTSVLNFLYVDGKYYQLSRSRIFGEPGTPAFGIECARTISNQQQYLKTKQIEHPITNIYLAGELSEESMEVCRESILQMDASLEVEKIQPSEGSGIRFDGSEDLSSISRYITIIGGLLCSKKDSNLLYQYRQNPELLKQRREFYGHIFPTVAAVAVMAMICIWQAAIWFSRIEILNTQLDYMGNPEVIARVIEYDTLLMENQMMGVRLDVINKTRFNLDSYPQYTTRVKATVEDCASGLASASISRFDAETGNVSIEATAQDAENIHRFVSRLEERQDFFEGIFYNGFQYDENAAVWRASINCYLLPSGEEVTP